MLEVRISAGGGDHGESHELQSMKHRSVSKQEMKTRHSLVNKVELTLLLFNLERVLGKIFNNV